MLTVVFALAGCKAGSEMVVADAGPQARAFAQCAEPRPLDCPPGPREPVCAELPRPARDCWKTHCPPGMTTKTYSSACFACADPTVTGYTPGKCSGEFSIF